MPRPEQQRGVQKTLLRPCWSHNLSSRDSTQTLGSSFGSSSLGLLWVRAELPVLRQGLQPFKVPRNYRYRVLSPLKQGKSRIYKEWNREEQGTGALGNLPEQGVGLDVLPKSLPTPLCDHSKVDLLGFLPFPQILIQTFIQHREGLVC